MACSNGYISILGKEMAPVILLILVILIVLGLVWLINKKPSDKPVRYFMASNAQRVTRAEDTLAGLQAQLAQCQTTNTALAAEEKALSSAVVTLESSVAALDSPDKFNTILGLVNTHIIDTTPLILEAVDKLRKRLETGLRFYPGAGTDNWVAVMHDINVHLNDAAPLLETAILQFVDLEDSTDFSTPMTSTQMLGLFKGYLSTQLMILTQLIEDIKNHYADGAPIISDLAGKGFLGTPEDIINLRGLWENDGSAVPESLNEIQGLVEYINTLEQSL